MKKKAGDKVHATALTQLLAGISDQRRQAIHHQAILLSRNSNWLYRQETIASAAQHSVTGQKVNV